MLQDTFCRPRSRLDGLKLFLERDGGSLALHDWTAATFGSNEASGFGYEAKMPADDLDDVCNGCRECLSESTNTKLDLRKHKPTQMTQCVCEVRAKSACVTRSVHALTVITSLRASHCAQDRNI